MDKVNWLKDNVRIFIDQNLPQRTIVSLKKRGWNNVLGVFDIKYVGANDGKLLKIIRENKMILSTYDQHFAKMASKYNKISILLQKRQGNVFSPRTLSIKIESELIQRFDEVKEYYEENGNTTNNKS